MTYKVTGYIIGKKDFREADRLYTIYTAEHGKIEAMAQGVRKLSSKLAGHLELFHKASFTIAKGKQIDRIATVDTIERSEDSKNIFEKCIAASYCSEITDTLVKCGERDERLYAALDDFFNNLRRAPHSKSVFLAKQYILKLSQILGYATYSLPQNTHAAIDRSIKVFLQNTLERPLRSEEFFRLFTPLSQK